MATVLQGFRLTARSCQCRPHAHRYLAKSIGRRRAFSIAAPRLADSKSSKAPPAKRTTSYGDVEIRPGNAEDLEGLARLTLLEEKLEKLLSGGEMEDKEDQVAWEDEVVDDFNDNGITPPDIREKRKLPQTYLNMGEQEPFEDEDFEFEADTHEELSSLAHGELEHHREMRHYARLAAWEMPLLSKFAKPFEKPTADMALRFRYTSYMGEQHPAEKKVVMEFCTLDMPNLTPVQRMKLIKLAGVRYNPETDIVRMSCEMFPSQAQNKRYLGDLVDDMLKEARDPKDTFEDVPLDLRHHTFKPKPKFPKAWRMTEARRAELAKVRENAELNDQSRMLAGQLVDGIKQIEEAWAKAPAQAVLLPEMLTAGKGAKGKGKRLAVKR